MEMSNITQRYVTLKQNIITAAVHKLSNFQLKHMIEQHENVIHSKRRSSYIKTFGDLISVLEKRCHLSKDKVGLLIEIASILNDSNVNEMVARYRYLMLGSSSSSTTTTTTTYSNNSVTSSAPSISESSYQTRSMLRPQAGLPPAVMKLVCDDIGTDWKDLVRELDVREGDIDAIEIKHPRNLREQAREGLKLFEQSLPAERHWLRLIKALNRIGRRDVRELIEEYLLNEAQF